MKRFRTVLMLVNLDMEVNRRSGSGSLLCPRILPKRVLGLLEGALSNVSSMETGERPVESWVEAKNIAYDASMPILLDDESPEHKTVCQQGRQSRSYKMIPKRSGG